MISVKRIGTHNLPIPQQQTSGAAGFDLCAAHCAFLHPGERAVIRSGFAWQVPTGMVGHIWPRSGLAVKHGIDTLAGVIDSDFTGEVGVVLINHGSDTFTIRPGDRIAQMVFGMYLHSEAVEVQELPATARGTDGFGSTGA